RHGGAVTPSNRVVAAIRVQKSAGRHLDEWGRGSLARRAAEKNGSSKNNLAQPHEPLAGTATTVKEREGYRVCSSGLDGLCCIVTRTRRRGVHALPLRGGHALPLPRRALTTLPRSLGWSPH